MKRELLHIAVVLYWAFVVGVAAPYLVSAPHSELHDTLHQARSAAKLLALYDQH